MRLSAGQPGPAAEEARAVRRRALAGDDVEAASVAERALGLAAKETGALAAAEAHLRRAAALARAGKLSGREGEARMNLACVLAMGGRCQAALEETDLAASLLPDDEVAQLEAQRGVILQRLGRQDEAMTSYRVAAASFSKRGRPLEAAQVYTNRGILHAYRRAFPAAEADLYAARDIYLALGLDVAAAEAHHNLGFVAARRGDVPAALACYDAAAEVFLRLGVPRPAALLDRCESLLAVGLVGEARRLAERAITQLEAAEMHCDLAEARLMLAEATLLEGDAGSALRTAEVAWRAFVLQNREGWAALGHYAVVKARWQRDGVGSTCPHEAVEVARELEAAGWAVPAADARLIAARAALGRGAPEEAEAHLLATKAASRWGPSELRARAWHAEALRRLARGRERSALAALRAGLSVVDQHQAMLGATELRVHARSQADELAELGLRIALRRGRPATVLSWAERRRASLHRLPRVRPPQDVTVAMGLAELRQVVIDLHAAALAGQDTTALLRRQAALEAAIRRHTRHLPGAGTAGLSRPASVASLSEALGERALVEMIELDDGLHAITLVEGRVRLRRLAEVSDVAREVAQLRFALRGVVHGTPRSSADTSLAALQHARNRLDVLLFGPLRPDVEERGIVIVPTGVLHRLPWAVLPTCRGRPFTVAPSATQWLLARQRPDAPPGASSVLVAGPSCAGNEEVAGVARLVGDATTLVGNEATVARVTDALDGAGLVHVVAHGTFRRDNPLFSSLQLADGPLTVYDLELLPRVPPVMVLSACDAGLSAVTAGDELMGLAAALLAFGAKSVVASVMSVPDDLTRPLMVELHRRLASGLAPSIALAGARSSLEAELGPGDPRTHAVSGFTCFGAG